MTDPSSTCGPRTSEDSPNVTSSQASEAGATPSDSPDGQTTDQSGLVHARASHLVKLGMVGAQPTSGIFGRSYIDSSSTADLQSCLENRLRVRLDGRGSALYSLTWKHWPIDGQPPICAQRASGHRTSGNGSTGWPTPIRSEDQRGRRKQDGKRGAMISEVLRGWQIPTVNDAKGSDYTYSQENHEKPFLKLPGEAKLAGWATPTKDEAGGTPERFLARKEALNGACGVSLTALNLQVQTVAGWVSPQAADANGSGIHQHTSSLCQQTRSKVSGQPATGSPASTENRGQLNPAHSRWLMGFPKSWDDCAQIALGASKKRSQMPKSAKPTPEKHCETCGVILQRARFNGRLEDLGAFRKRQFCSLSCANSREKGGDSSTTFHRRAGKHRKTACENCGVPHRRLHVHHRDENPANNEPANLQTLCPSCHKLSHLKAI